MPTLYNQVQLIGRAGHRVELLELADGATRANLRLYEKTYRPGQSGSANQAHTLIAWRGIAERMAAKIKRGDQLLVQGRLVNRRVEMEGFSYVRTEVHVAHFSVLSARARELSQSTVSMVAEPESPRSL